MTLNKRFHFFLCRIDKPERIFTCVSLDEAKRVARAFWRISSADNPVYNICTREGVIIAVMKNGAVRLA